MFMSTNSNEKSVSNEKPILNEQKFTTTTYDDYGNLIIDPYKTDDQYKTVMTEDLAKQQANINSAIKRNDTSVDISKEVGTKKNTPLGMVAKAASAVAGGIGKVFDAANKLPLPAKIAVMGAAGVATLVTAPVTGVVGGTLAVASGVIGGAGIVYSHNISKVAKGAGNTVTNVTGNKFIGGAVDFGINLAPGLLSGGLGAAAKAGTVTKLAATAISEGALSSADDVVAAGVKTIASSSDDIAKAVGSSVLNSGDDVAKLVGASDTLGNTVKTLTSATTKSGVEMATNATLTANKDVATAVTNALNSGGISSTGASTINNATTTIAKEGDKITQIIANGVKGSVRTGENIADDTVRMFNEFGKSNISGFVPATDIDDAINMARSYSGSGAFKSGIFNNGDKIVKALEKSKEALVKAGKPSSIGQAILEGKTEAVKAIGRKIPIVGKNLKMFAPKNIAFLNNNIALGRTFDTMSKSGSIISQYTQLGKLNALFPKSGVVNNLSKLLGVVARPLGDTVKTSAIASTFASDMGVMGNVLSGTAKAVNVGKYLAPNIDFAKSTLLGFSEAERHKLHEVLTDKAYTPEMREDYLTKIFQDPTKLIVPTSLVKQYGFDNYVYSDAYGFVDIANQRAVNTESLFREVYGDHYTINDIQVEMNNLFKGYNDNYNNEVSQTNANANDIANNKDSTDYEGYDSFNKLVESTDVDLPDIDYSTNTDDGYGY